MVKSKILLGGAVAAMLGFPAAALAGSVTLTATLSGANETGGGDPDGSGKFTAETDPDEGDLCFTLVVGGIGKASAAHIHSGAAGTDGKPVITLSVTEEGLDECVAAEPDLLKAIVAKPSDYYVNVHSADHPAGAVRGQLSKAK